MRKKILTLLTAFLILCLSQSVLASVIHPYDWGFYIDGTTYTFLEDGYDLSDIPALTGTLDDNLDTTSDDDSNTLTWSTSEAGDHNFIAWFDYEIDESINTFFNEFGAVTRSPVAGQSWEIDEPGYTTGDIYDNLWLGVLDNTNGVPAASIDDVSFAMGWEFSLTPGQTATIDLLISEAMPNSGFYLSQTDPDSDENIYFLSTLSISGTPVAPPIPEPSTLILFVFGLLGSTGLCRRKG